MSIPTITYNPFHFDGFYGMVKNIEKRLINYLHICISKNVPSLFLFFVVEINDDKRFSEL